MTVKLHMDKQQRGQTLTLSFTVTSNNIGEEVTSDEINVNNLAWVRFRFSFAIKDTVAVLQSTMSWKKHEEAKSARVIINLSWDELKKQMICRDDWIDEVKINSKRRDICIDTVTVACWLVNIIAREVTKPSPINKLFEDTVFTDFELCAEDGSVAVHKPLLSAYSDMFKRMLGGVWVETIKDSVEIPGVTVQTLQHFKEYMYFGTLPDDGLEPLLLLAEIYLMDTLKADCITKLAKRVRSDPDPEYKHHLIKFACQHNLSQLMTASFVDNN